MHTRNIGHSSTFLTQKNPNVHLSPSERTGRKSYKLSNRKGGEKKEAVWPPHLEAALLEGLRKYRPVSKSGRPLRRFTKRNVSISRHILATTGKSRTAKQVGSRLQQITESTKDAEIIRLITSREVTDTSGLDENTSTYSPTECGTSESPYASSSTIINTPSSSATGSDNGSPDTSLCNDQVSLFAQLVPSEVQGPVSYIGLDADITNTGINLFLSVDPAEGISSDISALYNARRLSNIPSSSLFDDIPTVSLSSCLISSTTSHICAFSVYIDAVKLIHSENTTLVPVKSDDSMNVAYITPLLPSYWETLVRRANIHRYTVILDVLEVDCGVALESGRRKFSIAINMKLNSPEGPMLASCTPYYENTSYDDIHIPTEYSDLPSANIPNTSYLPDLPLQIPATFQNSNMLPTWNDNGYFIPPSSFLQYPDLCDSRYETIPESENHSSYSYAQF